MTTVLKYYFIGVVFSFIISFILATLKMMKMQQFTDIQTKIGTILSYFNINVLWHASRIKSQNTGEEIRLPNFEFEPTAGLPGMVIQSLMLSWLNLIPCLISALHLMQPAPYELIILTHKSESKLNIALSEELDAIKVELLIKLLCETTSFQQNPKIIGLSNFVRNHLEQNLTRMNPQTTSSKSVEKAAQEKKNEKESPP